MEGILIDSILIYMGFILIFMGFILIFIDSILIFNAFEYPFINDKFWVA